EHKRAAKVHPRERCGEVLRRELRSEQPVHDHRRANNEEWNLEQGARVALLEQAAGKRNTQQIKSSTTQAGATPLISNWRSNFSPSGRVKWTRITQSPAIGISMLAL